MDWPGDFGGIACLIAGYEYRTTLFVLRQILFDRTLLGVVVWSRQRGCNCLIRQLLGDGSHQGFDTDCVSLNWSNQGLHEACQALSVREATV